MMDPVAKRGPEVQNSCGNDDCPGYIPATQDKAESRATTFAGVEPGSKGEIQYRCMICSALHRKDEQGNLYLVAIRDQIEK